MGHMMSIMDFPPAPKLDEQGRLDHATASQAEVRGETRFNKRCLSCHQPPYYTDNLAHDLKVERLHDHVGSTRPGELGRAEGPIKTFPLRGIKDSPPYLHDGRCLTLEDTVEFFNLVLGLTLSKQEKTDLVAFMRQL